MTLERLQNAYRLAAELRRFASDFLVDMRVELADGDRARVSLPARLVHDAGVRDIVGRFGSRLEQ